MARFSPLSYRPCRRMVVALRLLCALLLSAVAWGGCGSEQTPPPLPPPAPPSQPFAAADWSTYRGNAAQQGVAPGSLPSTLQLLWQFKTAGAIQSSAVVADDRVFVGSDDASVYALDRQSGAKLWSFATNGAVEAPPLVIGDTVYVGSADAWFYALSADQGTLRWKYQTGDKILAAATALPMPPDALTADSGAAPPNALSDTTTWVLVGSYDAKLYCFNAGSGRLIWTYQTENFVNGAVAIAGPLAVFGGCDKSIHRVQVKDGVGLARFDLGSPIANTPAVHAGTAYVGHYGNAFVAVDIATGATTWTYKDRSFPYFSSPAVTADRVVFGARDKRVHCADRLTGAQQWTFSTQGRVDSSPVICAGKVVVGSADGRLYLLDLADGTELFSYEIGGALTASPAVQDGQIFIGSDDGSLYAFGAQKPAAPRTDP